jgi:hypothetical protein
MAIHRVVLTYEDYLAMPDDGRRYEILDGEVAVTTTPATDEQVLDGYELDGAVYRPTGRVQGDARIPLPPFPDLARAVDELWQR